MSWQPFDLVRVPFPFTDRQTSKRRPALVLSNMGFQNDSEHLYLEMVTSSAAHSHWLLDWPIQEIKTAGLPIPCVVRFKLFTLDQPLVFRTPCCLSSADRLGVGQHLNNVLALASTSELGDS